MSVRPLKILCLAAAVCIGLHASALVAAEDLNSMERLRAVKLLWIQTYLSTHDLDSADRAAKIPIYPNPRPPDVDADIQYLRDHRLSFFHDAQ